MLNALISLFGFAKVAPKPAPKRPATARAKPVATKESEAPGPDLRLRAAERAAYAEDQIARAARSIHTVGAAAHIFARSIGQVGERPSAIHLNRASDVLGLRRLPYFQALHLSGRRVPLLPLGAVGDADREAGFADGIDRDLNGDLDLWAGVRELERKAADLARRTARPIPEPIAIPADIVTRLLERDRLRADRAGAGGKGRLGPQQTPDPETATPLPEPDNASRGNRCGKRRDDDDDEETPKRPHAVHLEPEDDEPPKGPKG